jgi:hypothetical protein
MIAGHYERRTKAAMEVALDRVCERWPNGGTHKVRKRAARGIIRCADTGHTSVDALIEAGERALAATRSEGHGHFVRSADCSVSAGFSPSRPAFRPGYRRV